MSDEKTIINESGNGKAVMGRWSRRVIDGSVGILLGTTGGAAAAYAMGGNGSEAAGEEASPVESAGEPAAAASTAHASTPSGSHSRPVILDEAHLAHNVNDNMSFGQAFAAARAEVGPGGVFTWRGGVYGTYYENEWNAMDADDRARYYASISPDVSEQAAGHYAHGEAVHEPVNPGDLADNHRGGGQADVTDGGHGSQHAHEAGNSGGTGGDDGDVKVIGEPIDIGDGRQMVGIEVGGHNGVVIASDGEPDVAIIDVDDSNDLTPPDVIIDMKTGNAITAGDYVARMTAGEATGDTAGNIAVTHVGDTDNAPVMQCDTPDPVPSCGEEMAQLGAEMPDDIDVVNI